MIQDVRLLSACVLVNLLRIFAPDAPFDSTTLLVRWGGAPCCCRCGCACRWLRVTIAVVHSQTVFDLIVAQIRGLERVEGAAYDRCFYILESLATVQTSNALVAIAQDAEMDDDEAALALQESASETLVELFDTLLSRVTCVLAGLLRCAVWFGCAKCAHAWLLHQCPAPREGW